MSDDPKPIRRVVTGNDENGRSRVLFDSAAPNVNPGAVVRGTCMTDLWVFKELPAPISGTRDDGKLPFHFEPPHAGGHLRIVQSPAKPANYDPAKDPAAKPLTEPRRRPDGVLDRGGQNAYSSPIHKSETVDYGILLEGERLHLRAFVAQRDGMKIVRDEISGAANEPEALGSELARRLLAQGAAEILAAIAP